MKSNFKILPIFFDIEKLQQATNELFTKMSWKQHIVKGLCMTQIPGDPSSADGDKLRGVFYTKPDSTGKEVRREKAIDENKYTEFVDEFKQNKLKLVSPKNNLRVIKRRSEKLSVEELYESIPDHYFDKGLTI